MLFDTHIHTLFSSDSAMSIQRAVKRGKQLNMGITITDHMDIGYPIAGMYTFDTKDYFNTYEKYRSAKVLLGVELGMRKEFVEEISKKIIACPFDYIIGSIHVIDNIDLSWSKYYEGRTKPVTYSQYLSSLTSCVKVFNFIDSLGHIDYICRHANYADNNLHYHEFSEYIDDIFIKLAQNEKALEINTRRLRNPEAIPALLIIYKRWAELGGKLVTIGSDAHNVTTIGSFYEEALDFAACCGLQPVYFKNHQPEYIGKHSKIFSMSNF
jgi:histidinol-phosphatase (PHP family)